MLIKNTVSINLVINFDLTFDDATLNRSILCKQGDKVEASIIVLSAGEISETINIIGVIKKITVSIPIENDNNPILEIDASEEFYSKIYTVRAYDIIDIKLVTDEPIVT